MKVKYLNDGFLIEPETDFEVEFLDGFRGDLKAFLKCGISANDIVGIRVCKENKTDKDITISGERS